MNTKAARLPGDDYNSAEEIRELAHRLFQIADSIEEAEDRLSVDASSTSSARASKRMPHEDLHLGLIARSLYQLRRRRSKWFPDDLFAEPAWDMLLDLFVNFSNGKLITTTSICHAAEVPLTTGLRWIGLLETAGLVERFRVADDSRVNGVRMTKAGYQAVRGCISEWLQSQDANLTMMRLSLL